MANLQNDAAGRRRLLVAAYHFHPEYSMESRLAWHRARHAASEFDVTVVCARTDGLAPPGTEYTAWQDGHAQSVEIVRVARSRVERALMERRVTYYAGYRLWLRRAFRAARAIHHARPFAAVHHVSFCGFREPGHWHRLGAPVIWGPIGGTHYFPIRFLGCLGTVEAVSEVARNCINWVHLHLSRRVRRAVDESEVVLAATNQVADEFAKAFGYRPDVELETGIGVVRQQPRVERNEQKPLKILWAGRLKPWKGLPLLFRALSELPSDCRYTLRVLGEGSAGPRWRRLAQRLGIASNIEWVGWPAYPEQLPYYDWADVFAFTSLRDTSGTGLLEALAAGAPIIGLDHQGAADIMTDACSIQIPIRTSREAVTAFRDAIARISRDKKLLDQLSVGALERAAAFQWTAKGDAMQNIYQKAICETPSMAGSSRADRRRRQSATCEAGEPALLLGSIQG